MGFRLTKLHFTNGFHGTLETKRATTKIGVEEGELRPYDLLQGSIAGCYYKTFLEILDKRDITIGAAELEVKGVNRREAPTTLETVDITLTLLEYPQDQVKHLRRAADLAALYCSIYQTVSHVATITHTLVLAN